MAETEGYPPERAPTGVTRVRQGRLGRDVFIVLLVSTILAAIGLLAAWSWRYGDLASTEPHNAKQPSDAASFQSPPPGEMVKDK